MFGNQHNLAKTARNFDASPAATTGMRQDNFVGVKTGILGVDIFGQTLADLLVALSILSIPFF